MSNKKILILGGNTAQVPLIQAAKNEGYIVVLCDYTTTNPGIPLADIHYQQDFMDREAVLAIAKKEKINGVISNSEPAMQIVAYVSEQLNLVGNPEKSVRMLRDKFQFRELLDRVGAFCPKHILTSSFEEAERGIDELSFPVIIKPCISSASRGTTIVKNFREWDVAKQAWDECSTFSENDKVLIEEYVEMPSLDVIEGEVFINDGNYIWNGIFTTKRSKKLPLVPMTYLFPADLDCNDYFKVQKTLFRVFEYAGLKHGEYNVELYFNRDHQLFCIEINIRQGGKGLPGMIKNHSGIDMYKLLVTTAVGDKAYFEEVQKGKKDYNYVTRHLVFSHNKGRFESIYVSPEIQKYIREIKEEKAVGSIVDIAKDGRDSLAWIDMEFKDQETQLRFAGQLEKYIYPIVL